METKKLTTLKTFIVSNYEGILELISISLSRENGGRWNWTNARDVHGIGGEIEVSEAKALAVLPQELFKLPTATVASNRNCLIVVVGDTGKIHQMQVDRTVLEKYFWEKDGHLKFEPVAKSIVTSGKYFKSSDWILCLPIHWDVLKAVNLGVKTFREMLK
jgi:hypothetical protein